MSTRCYPFRTIPTSRQSLSPQPQPPPPGGARSLSARTLLGRPCPRRPPWGVAGSRDTARCPHFQVPYFRAKWLQLKTFFTILRNSWAVPAPGAPLGTLQGRATRLDALPFRCEEGTPHNILMIITRTLGLSPPLAPPLGRRRVSSLSGAPLPSEEGSTQNILRVFT